ncbi:MAG: SGNH/GDSL hydrolase family protein [Acidobacteria bacterium]|nr:SGNH/GDSL hydrolase family protein [Acidobacteriota bacterium]
MAIRAASDKPDAATGQPRRETPASRANEPGRLNEPSRLKKLIFGGILAAGIMGFAEATCAVYYFLILPEQRREAVEGAIGLGGTGPNQTVRYVAHPYFNFVNNPLYATASGFSPHGPMGIRATSEPPTAKRNGIVRIIALGASTTYGYYFEDGSRVWPSLLEARLREEIDAGIEVLNVSVPSHTTYELIGIAAMWIPEFHPDVVLLHTGLNDAFTVAYPDEGGPDNSTFRYAWTHRQVPPLVRGMMRASYLGRVIGMGWLSRGIHAVGDMSDAVQFPRPDRRSAKENIKRATGRYFRRNVETIVALIRRTGAVPVLINMPLNPDWKTGQDFYYDAVSVAVRRNNGILVEIAEKEGLVLIDLYSQMRDPAIYLDAVHVNEEGMRQKSAHVAGAIRPILPRSERGNDSR